MFPPTRKPRKNSRKCWKPTPCFPTRKNARITTSSDIPRKDFKDIADLKGSKAAWISIFQSYSKTSAISDSVLTISDSAAIENPVDAKKARTCAWICRFRLTKPRRASKKKSRSSESKTVRPAKEPAPKTASRKRVRRAKEAVASPARKKPRSEFFPRKPCAENAREPAAWPRKIVPRAKERVIAA